MYINSCFWQNFALSVPLLSRFLNAACRWPDVSCPFQFQFRRMSILWPFSLVSFRVSSGVPHRLSTLRPFRFRFCRASRSTGDFPLLFVFPCQLLSCSHARSKHSQNCYLLSVGTLLPSKQLFLLFAVLIIKWMSFVLRTSFSFWAL